MPNLEFEIKILRSGKKKYEVARLMNWHPSKLSTVLSGTYEPSKDEKEQLAEVMHCQAHELFPEKQPVEAA